MPISESGQLSLGNIATEKGESLANISLATLSTNNINTQSPYYPDGAQPHSVSEFYGYDHNAGPSGPSDPILHYYELVGAYPSQEFACFDGPNVPPQSYYFDNVQPDLVVHAYSDRDGNEQIMSGWYFDPSRLVSWEYLRSDGDGDGTGFIQTRICRRR